MVTEVSIFNLVASLKVTDEDDVKEWLGKAVVSEGRGTTCTVTWWMGPQVCSLVAFICIIIKNNNLNYIK